jgi:hypothetical protein
MKNLFKFGFLALAISLSIVACNSDKATEEATDSVAVDSVAVDTTVVDSTVVDSTAADTTAAM